MHHSFRCPPRPRPYECVCGSPWSRYGPIIHTICSTSPSPPPILSAFPTGRRPMPAPAPRKTPAARRTSTHGARLRVTRQLFRSLSARSLNRLDPFPHSEELKGSSEQTRRRLRSAAVQETWIGRHLSGPLLSFQRSVLYFHSCCSLWLSQHLSDGLTCRGPEWQEIERNHFPLGNALFTFLFVSLFV